MIEKNIFQSWYTYELHPTVRHKIDTIKTMNPGYKYHLYNDEDMDKFVNTYFIGEIADCYNKLNIIVAKVDLWRYLVLYKFGGIYLDIDSDINLPLDNLINDDDDAIITAEGNPYMYVQWALIFSKNHQILKKTIDIVVDNIKNNNYPNDIHKMTGPTAYTKAINYIHKNKFNNIISREKIGKDTNIIFKSCDISYRLFGVDYYPYFSFSNNTTKILYSNKKDWRQEEKDKQLLIT
jgi:mannosyltransferase OCH1-like enzyme